MDTALHSVYEDAHEDVCEDVCENVRVHVHGVSHAGVDVWTDNTHPMLPGVGKKHVEEVRNTHHRSMEQAKMMEDIHGYVVAGGRVADMGGDGDMHVDADVNEDVGGGGGVDESEEEDTTHVPGKRGKEGTCPSWLDL